LDKERFTSIHVHQKYNVPSRGRDKGIIARNVLSNKRQGKLVIFNIACTVKLKILLF
jgi:hypothetical protein